MDLLRALGTFSRIAETGSFSAVARESASSQSAVSRIIDQLEAHFEVRLFHRTTRHISLTEDGQELLNHAHRLLETASELNDSVGGQRKSPSGLVRMGITASAATLLVPRLEALYERHPDIAVELVVGDGFHDLIEERLDLALQMASPNDSSAVTRLIGELRRVLVATPAYLQRHGMPAHPTDLVGYPCVIHETGPGGALWRLTGADGTHEVAVSGRFRTNNNSDVHHAALAGYGVASLWEGLVAEDVHAGRLCRVLSGYSAGDIQVHLVYPTRRHLAPRTRVMIEFVAEQLRQLTRPFVHAS